MKSQAKKKSLTSGSIRIIAGQWRGRKLPVLNVQGLRPTTDRTKETLFNWLAPYIVGRHCLDAFAGSGGLGFEALSRHAASCVFIELDKSACQIIRQNCQTLQLTTAQVTVLNDDINVITATLNRSFDLIFVDPPFNQGLVEPLTKQISKHNLLANDGLIYIESELANSNYAVPSDWQLLKQRQTKQVCYRLYQRDE